MRTAKSIAFIYSSIVFIGVSSSKAGFIEVSLDAQNGSVDTSTAVHRGDWKSMEVGNRPGISLHKGVEMQANAEEANEGKGMGAALVEIEAANHN